MEKIIDGQGRVTTRVEGKPQAFDLGTDVEGIERTIDTKIQIVIKPADILKDFQDATSGAVATQGQIGLFFIGTAVELLYRTRWLGIKWRPWPIIDFVGSCFAQDTCAASVTGTIETVRTYSEPDDEGFSEEDVLRSTLQVSLQPDPERPGTFIDAGSTYTASRDIHRTIPPCSEIDWALDGAGGFLPPPEERHIFAVQDGDRLDVIVFVELAGTRTNSSCNGPTSVEDVEPAIQRIECGFTLVGQAIAQNADGSRTFDMICDETSTNSEGIVTSSARGTLTVR